MNAKLSLCPALELAAGLWLLAISPTAAQPFVEAWVQSYESHKNAPDEGWKVAADASGNVIVAGITTDVLSGRDLLVIKYSGAGVPLWTNYHGGQGTGSEGFEGLAVDAIGDVVVTAWSELGGASPDYVTLKYSAAGVPLWTNRFSGPGSGYDSAAALAVDPNGNVVVTARSDAGGGNPDYVTIKYSNGGVPMWTNRYNGTGNGSDAARAVALDGEGNVVVTGYSEVGGGNFDYVTIKYLASGTPLWTNRYSGPGHRYDAANALAVDGDGNISVTGTITVNDFGYQNLATIKYSAAGVPLWTNLYMGPGNSAGATALAVDGSGNVVVTGTTAVDSGDDTDWATIKYSAGGVPLWTNRYSGPGNRYDSANALAVDGNGNVFVAGSARIDDFSDHDYATVAYSSAGVPLWTNRFSGPGNKQDTAAAVAVDGLGNVFVTGTAQVDLLGDTECATIKYSASGAALWTNHFNNGQANGEGQANALAVDSGGNVIVTGKSDGSGSATDYATIKYSSAGVPLWTNRYNGSANWYDEAAAVALDANDDVVVTGVAIWAIPGSLNSVRGFTTIKYSTVGVPLWTNRYGGAGTFLPALAVDKGGNVVIAGMNDDQDYLTIKYSGAGVPLWTNFYIGPGNGIDNARAIAIDGNGDVIVTGSSDGAGSYDDYLTIKYSAAGVPLWTNRYNGPLSDTDIASAIAVDGSGNVFVTGRSWNGDSDDYVTVAYSSAGVPLWIRRYDGTDPETTRDDTGTAIAVDATGNVFVSGYSGGSDPFFHGYVTIKYSNAGVPLWTNRYPGFISQRNLPAMVVDSRDNVYVTGDSGTVTYSDTGVPLSTNLHSGTALAVGSTSNGFVTTGPGYITVRYTTPLRIPLHYQMAGNQLVLGWTDAAFSLQTAPAIQGTYTNIPGAVSPYTNPVSGPQRYFRLRAN